MLPVKYFLLEHHGNKHLSIIIVRLMALFIYMDSERRWLSPYLSLKQSVGTVKIWEMERYFFLDCLFYTPNILVTIFSHYLLLIAFLCVTGNNIFYQYSR